MSTQPPDEKLGEALMDVIVKAWPYRQVEIVGAVHECNLCRCLVADKQAHALACFTSQDETTIARIGQELGHIVRTETA